MNKLIIKQIIKKNRPNISDSSLLTYVSLLNSLYKSLFKNDKNFSETLFNKTDEVLEHIKDKPLASKKTVLSALYVLTENPKYRDHMITDATKYNSEQKEQKLTDKQKENWVSQDEIKQVFNKYKTTAEYLIKELKGRPLSNKLTSKEFQTWQDYIMLCLSSGVFIEPQRVKDWTSFKINNIDKGKDNYMEGKASKCQLVFNSYKTAKFYGEKKLVCPPELCKILTAFVNYVKPQSDYLLNDSNWKPLSQVTFTQRLNKIFNKNVSVNILRHSYLTDRFQSGKISLKQLSDTAKNMSHNLETSLEYVKLDAITNKPEENIQLKVEENPEEKEIEAEKVEEPVKPKRPRGRPKKQKE
jgi:hypothetical protein